MADDILIGDTPKALRRRRRLAEAETAGRLWKHSRLSDVLGLVSEDDIAEMQIFTLIRNPWDRMVSYYHWLQAQTFAHPGVRLARRLPFDAFVAHPVTRAAFAAETFGDYVALPGSGELQAHFLRLEHLDEDIAPVEAHLGFRLTPLPRSNRSTRAEDYRSVYDDRTAARVGELCQTDIDRFGYRF